MTAEKVLHESLDKLLPSFDLSRQGEQGKPVVGIAAADHASTLQSAVLARNTGLADFLLFGEPDAVKMTARKFGIDISGMELVSCSSHEAAAAAASEAASSGIIQVLMKGAVHTADFTRAFLAKSRGLVSEGGLTSHVALVSTGWYHKPFLLTDSALNINPDLVKKEKILINALKVAGALGAARPKVACIAPVETVSEKIQSTVDAQQLVLEQRSRQRFGKCIIEGPLALDAALSFEAAQVKGIDGEVPGDPDLLLLPNLDASNALYKSFILQPGNLGAGIIAGLKVPVVLTSRSDSDLTRFLSLAMALAVSGFS